MKENSAIRNKCESLLITKNNRSALSPCTEAESGCRAILYSRLSLFPGGGGLGGDVRGPCLTSVESTVEPLNHPPRPLHPHPEFTAPASLSELIWQPGG